MLKRSSTLVDSAAAVFLNTALGIAFLTKLTVNLNLYQNINNKIMNPTHQSVVFITGLQIITSSKQWITKTMENDNPRIQPVCLKTHL